ncbi:exo-alpha-sialidase [Ferribacterium limneticum]|uniref:exo-alpha-sialidase n=1 Tax=Ferribacterium limneticum TaxID=76259 RepID=UPI001CFA5887|nr:sialidase family protein [Ferribacterium limneticum]UCV18467.1 exo-alpha-sialidase [Ferribacterium limneticum]
MPPPYHPVLLFLFTAALAGAFWRAPTPGAAAFAPPPAAAASTLPALFVNEMLWRDAGLTAAAPNLTELPDGRIAAAWLAGPEDAMTVHFSVRDRGGWRSPVQVATPESTAGGTFAQIGRLGNPVLHAEGSWLHLWYASSTLGSSINHSVSTDGGKSWTKPARLQTSPFANFGGAVRCAPVPLADGGLGLAISHDFIGQHGEWLRLSATGQILDKARLPAITATLQPAAAALDDQRAMAVLRDAGPAPGSVRVATTDNGGQRWQAGEAIAVPNPNASVALLRLKSGRLLLAGNPASGRQALLLLLSADQGKTWQEVRTVETAPDGGADYGNPSLQLGRDGRIHLAYDWRRQGIKHVVFSEAWLDGGQP